MPIFDIFSRRKRRAEQGEPDVYQFTHVPEPLRIQVCYILDSALGPYDDRGYGGYSTRNNETWRFIHETLCREKGLFYLARRQPDPKQDCLDAVCTVPAIDDWLDIVELCFRCVAGMRGWSKDELSPLGVKQGPRTRRRS